MELHALLQNMLPIGNHYHLTLKTKIMDSAIQRLKNLKSNPMSDLKKEELADEWLETKTDDEWIELLKKHGHYGYDMGITVNEFIQMWEDETNPPKTQP